MNLTKFVDPAILDESIKVNHRKYHRLIQNKNKNHNKENE